MKLNTIEYYTEIAMLENPEFRKHENRFKLFLFLRQRHKNKKMSFASVERCQRKLWSEGKCLPLGEYKKEWERIRKTGVKKYQKYVRR